MSLEGKYIVPAVGKIYTNRSGGEFRCIYVTHYGDDALEQWVVEHGEHIATFERVKDGWTLDAHGTQKYEDGTIEWNYSTGGHFPRLSAF